MAEKKKNEVSEQQIQEWKQKFESVFKFDVEGKTCYIKKPGRKELSHAAAVSGSDPFKFNAQILDDCWLAGDEDIKTNDRLFFAVCEKMDQIIEKAEASIKKL